jgi:hypothetical protein
VRIIVCGGRHYGDREHVFSTLDMLHELYGFTLVIHGAASGADTLAGEWARSRGVRERATPAEWDKFGRAAGFWRNQKMLDMEPKLVVAFAGGKGTEGMKSIARDDDVRVLEV